ncbi:MAG: hypothetical protein AB7E79_04485 [Rhodospirillaceae bacterium]
MRTSIAAALTAAMTLQIAAPAAAGEFFNRNTILGWRQQSGPAVVAYVRAPIGPRTFKAKARMGLAVAGPRAYSPGQSPLYSQGSQVLDFALIRGDRDARWSAQLAVGNGVAWTNNRDSIHSGQVNLMESGLSWVAVGAITVGLAVATLSMIEKDGQE